MSELNDILNNSKDRLPEEKLKAYLEGKLSPEEQHEVEVWLTDEGMEADALEGLRTLPVSESAEIAKRINYTLQHELHKKARRRSKVIKDNNWAWIAAIILLLLCIIAYAVIQYSIGQ